MLDKWTVAFALIYLTFFLDNVLLTVLVLQFLLLADEQFEGASAADEEEQAAEGGADAVTWACAGSVCASTAAMAALEACVPARLAGAAPAWARGLVFVPDSAAYLAAASGLGAAARAVGAEPVALAGQALVGAGALALAGARSAGALLLPHAAVGAGLGAVDAALVPALLARARSAPARAAAAARLQAAAAAAYAAAPAAAGALARAAGFDTAMRALAVLNLLYAALLYRTLRLHPLSEQWGAAPVVEDPPPEPAQEAAPPPEPPLKQYSTFRSTDTH